MDYISTANQKEASLAYRITAIIVAAFCVMPVLLLLLGKFVFKPHFDGDLARAMQWGKYAYTVAIVVGLIAVIIRRFGLGTLQRGPRVPVGKILNQLRLISLVVAALGELIAIIGFVTFLLIGDFEPCWRLGVVGLLLMLYSFPRLWEWHRIIAARAQD